MALDFVVYPSSAKSVTVTLDSTPSAADCMETTLNTYTALFCTALFTGLAPNSQHSYYVNSSAGSSAVYQFTSEPSSRPPVFAIYADFGLGNDVSLTSLIQNADSFDYVIHAGECALFRRMNCFALFIVACAFLKP